MPSDMQPEILYRHIYTGSTQEGVFDDLIVPKLNPLQEWTHVYTLGVSIPEGALGHDPSTTIQFSMMQQEVHII